MAKKTKSKNDANLSKNTLTVPNVISFFRIILITPFVVCFLDEKYIPATIIIVISGLSDFFDGQIARRFHQESELGKILDPLADKLTLIAVGVCLIVIEPFVLPLMIVLVTKDFLMLVGGTDVIKHGMIPPKSKWYGKLGTLMFYVTVVAIVLMEIIGYENQTLSIIMLSATAAMMIFSLVNYAVIYVQLRKEYQNMDQHKKITAQVTKAEEKPENNAPEKTPASE